MQRKSIKTAFFAASLAAFAQFSSAAFVDYGDYTTVTELGWDVYDITAFNNMTHAEALDAIANLGSGWRMASSNEVNSIYELLDEDAYVGSVRHLLGYYQFDVDGNTYYNTSGRYSDVEGAFYFAGGFGSGIYHVRMPPEVGYYGWGMGGSGWAGLENERSIQTGAWAIRDVDVPLPAAALLFGSALAPIAWRLRRRGG